MKTDKKIAISNIVIMILFFINVAILIIKAILSRPNETAYITMILFTIVLGLTTFILSIVIASITKNKTIEILMFVGTFCALITGFLWILNIVAHIMLIATSNKNLSYKEDMKNKQEKFNSQKFTIEKDKSTSNFESNKELLETLKNIIVFCYPFKNDPEEIKKIKHEIYAYIVVSNIDNVDPKTEFYNYFETLNAFYNGREELLVKSVNTRILQELIPNYKNDNLENIEYRIEYFLHLQEFGKSF
ncbi:hypothetical protein [[Mycoplasma] anseris]|uniref:Uncharacterized protein n=1 Tax=[Mycoplasma] anseris TaxID=92400 RepID=A0A2Z4NCB3_9BACT|nr:hypothetical protein [[Mycoplasma] anseris]AWX69190.1 hypothetical protein DP065_00210 [[Mycoplasma] anseris]